MESHSRFMERATSRKRLSSNSVLGFGARKRAEQVILPSNELAIALTGGKEVRKEGFIQSKVYGFSRGWLTGWKRKYMTLENGTITFYSQKEVLAYGVEDGIPESSINLVDVRSIEYESKGDHHFSITLGEEKAAESFIKRTSRSLKHTLSRASMGSFSSHLSDSSESSENQYCETKICFRIKDTAEAEEWVRSILLSIRNQALFLDEAVKRMLDQNASAEVAESFLRQAVDLWTLAVGAVNEKTRKAKQQLAEYLQTHDTKSEEAELWFASAIETQRTLNEMRTSKSGNPFGLNSDIEALKVLRFSGKVTGLKKLQLEVAAFDLGYPLDEIIEFSEGEGASVGRKWSSDVSYKSL